MSSLMERYRTEVAPQLREARQYTNPMRVPRLTKIVVNIGVGTSADHDTLNSLVNEIAMITGQRPVITKARKSISNFKLREGMEVGAKVTLRGRRMYEFLERLIQAALPRIRDFRGVSATSFDGHGNYSLGLQEQTIFPEIDPDKVSRTQGMDITLVTTAETDDEARDLLRGLGMPFSSS